MLGLMVAFQGNRLGRLTGDTFCDGRASVLIGVILGTGAIWRAHEIKGLLAGESAWPRVVACIRRMADELGGVEHLNEVPTLHLSPDYFKSGRPLVRNQLLLSLSYSHNCRWLISLTIKPAFLKYWISEMMRICVWSALGRKLLIL